VYSEHRQVDLYTSPAQGQTGEPHRRDAGRYKTYSRRKSSAELAADTGPNEKVGLDWKKIIFRKVS
jgi:hypothetical protein